MYWNQVDDNAKRQIIKACNRRRKKAERDANKKDKLDAAQGDQMDLWKEE